MKTLILSLFFMLISSFSMANADDCLYDQDSYRELYDNLKQEYSDTKYVKEKKALEINLPKSKLVIWYGGCEYYSTEINYYSKINERFDEKEKLFDKVVELTKSFGSHMVEPNVLESLLNNKKYNEVEPNMYMVVFASTKFIFSYSDNKGKSHISIEFYQ